MGSQALTIEGIYEDVVREVLLQKIDQGEPRCCASGGLGIPGCVGAPGTTASPFL